MSQVIKIRCSPGVKLPRKLSRTVKKAARTALSAQGIGEECEIAVLITDNDGIHELNREFRDVDGPTDVLSFPQFDLAAGEAFFLDLPGSQLHRGRIMLGDIAINLPRTIEQGEEYGHGVEKEIAYLSVHSVLHLLGYDHIDEGEQKTAMRKQEEYIMGMLAGELK